MEVELPFWPWFLYSRRCSAQQWLGAAAGRMLASWVFPPLGLSWGLGISPRGELPAVLCFGSFFFPRAPAIRGGFLNVAQRRMPLAWWRRHTFPIAHFKCYWDSNSEINGGSIFMHCASIFTTFVSFMIVLIGWLKESIQQLRLCPPSSPASLWLRVWSPSAKCCVLCPPPGARGPVRGFLSVSLSLLLTDESRHLFVHVV